MVEDRELGSLELKPAETLKVTVTDAEQRPVAARISIFRTANARRGADLMSLGHRWRVASSSNYGSPWRMLPADAEGRLTIERIQIPIFRLPCVITVNIKFNVPLY